MELDPLLRRLSVKLPLRTARAHLANVDRLSLGSRQAEPCYGSYFGTDGKRLHFPVQDRQSDVWLVEIKQ